MSTISATTVRSRKGRTRTHLLPLLVGGLFTVGAVGVVAYLLWPTWGSVVTNAPDRLPVSVGGTLFNVPTAAIRMKIQRHTGPQERIDLAFLFPSLDIPDGQKHAEPVEAAVQPIDRIFLSIAAQQDPLSPEARASSIYPRYLDQTATMTQDGLGIRPFRAGTPYEGEDLFSAGNPAFTARCTRDAATPGMCLSGRRIGGADLTYRFPRSWLSNWTEVAEAMDRLTAQLRGPKG